MKARAALEVDNQNSTNVSVMTIDANQDQNINNYENMSNDDENDILES